MGATHGRVYRLLYFVKSKSGTKCESFAVLLCSFNTLYIHIYIYSFIFPEMAGMGLQPASKFATGAIYPLHSCMGAA